MAYIKDKLLSDPELEKLIALAETRVDVMAKLFFPERFSRPWSKTLHSQIFSILHNDTAKRKLILAPRSLGKTSIVQLALAAQRILFRKANFVVPISCTEKLALQQSENLKRELQANVMIKKIFGDVKTKNFSKQGWESSTGTYIMPRSAGQQVRGLLYNNDRPDLILFDDFEDPHQIRNASYRQQLREWFTADVLNCVNRSSDAKWEIIYVDTLKHEDALAARLLADPDWLSARLRLADENLESNYPEFRTTEEVKAEYAKALRDGQADVWARENLNEAIDHAHALFKREHFQYYQPGLFESKAAPKVSSILLCDPARTSVKNGNAETALIVVSIDYAAKRYYVREIRNGHFSPSEMLNHAFDLIVKYRIMHAGFEITGLHEFLTQGIRNEMVVRGVFFDLVELSAPGGQQAVGKDERIAHALAPLYMGKYIWHNAETCYALEQQLLMFPRSAKIDIADALSYLPQMLALGDQYWWPNESSVDSDLEEYDKLERLYGTTERLPEYEFL